MAENRHISELPEASHIADSDLFVVEQNGNAKKLFGSTMKEYTTLDIISAIAETLAPNQPATASYNPDSKTITFGIPTGPQGSKGDTGETGPKGDTGETGDNATITSTQYGTTSSSSVQPQTWQDTIPQVESGSYLWTKINWNTGSSNIFCSRYGSDGEGSFPSQAEHINEFLSTDGTSPFWASVNVTAEGACATGTFRGEWNNWSSVPGNSELYPLDTKENRKPKTNDFCVLKDASDFSGIFYTFELRYKDATHSTLFKSDGSVVILGDTSEYEDDEVRVISGWEWKVYAVRETVYDGVTYPVGSLITSWIRTTQYGTKEFVYSGEPGEYKGHLVLIYKGDWDSIAKAGWSVGYSTDSLPIPWGNINGDIADQTDLANALAEKAPSSHTHTKSEITDFPSSMTPTAHNQAASTITAGTLAGKVQANASAAATLGSAQVRDIYAGTSDMTAGTSPLPTGSIYLVYE